VHAVIEAAELERNLQRTGPARAELERIEHAHFDVRQGIEQQRQGLVRANTVIVDQESHADATLGGGAQPVHEHDASRIVIVDVGLDVDGPGGLVGQLGAQQQGERSAVDQHARRLARMRGELFRADGPEQRRLVVRVRLRDCRHVHGFDAGSLVAGVAAS
jgi:hypothetical protein